MIEIGRSAGVRGDNGITYFARFLTTSTVLPLVTVFKAPMVACAVRPITHFLAHLMRKASLSVPILDFACSACSRTWVGTREDVGARRWAFEAIRGHIPETLDDHFMITARNNLRNLDRASNLLEVLCTITENLIMNMTTGQLNVIQLDSARLALLPT